jgi:hypothetical protein
MAELHKFWPRPGFELVWPWPRNFLIGLGLGLECGVLESIPAIQWLVPTIELLQLWISTIIVDIHYSHCGYSYCDCGNPQSGINVNFAAHTSN